MWGRTSVHSLCPCEGGGSCGIGRASRVLFSGLLLSLCHLQFRKAGVVSDTELTRERLRSETVWVLHGYWSMQLLNIFVAIGMVLCVL